MGKVIDFENFTGGFNLLVDTGASLPVATAVLSFPNDTQVTVSGDEEVVKQIINRLDGLTIEYTTPPIKGKE